MRFPRLPKTEWLPATALAVGSGIGAAAGIGCLPRWTLSFLLIVPFLLKRKSALLLLAGSALCFASGLRHLAAEKTVCALFPENAARVSGVLNVTDTRLAETEGLPMPQGIRGEFVPAGSDETFPVTASFPKKGPLPQPHGRFRVTGLLISPRAPGFLYDGEKIGHALRPPYGGDWLLRVNTAENLPGKKGVLSFFAPLREALTGRLTARLESQSVRGMAARLFFGVSEGASAGQKADFVLSGTIHLFAVSGLHVGILAMLLLFLLRFLPFAWRYYGTAALILLYLFCTGANVPAMRAGAMIISWCLLRAHLFFSPGWNILMLGWSLLMFFHPGEVDSMGTQYSFGITAALILFWEKIQFFRDAASPELLLMPDHAPYTLRRKQAKYRLFRRLGALCVAPLAFLSGAAVTLVRQNLFLPGSILPNLVLPLLMPFLFLGMLFKMIFGACFTCCDDLGAKWIGCAFQILSRIAGFCAAHLQAHGAAEPAWYEFLLYYAAFFSLLAAKRFRTALLAGALLSALLCYWLLPRRAEGPEVMIFSGMADRPVTAVVRPAGGERAFVLNLPDPGTGALAGQELRRLGITRAELCFSRANGSCSGGTAAFSRRVQISACHLPCGKVTSAFRRNCSGIPAQRVRSFRFPDPRIPQQGSGGVLRWEPLPEFRLLCRDEDGGRRIRLEGRSRAPREFLIPWSSALLLWREKYE